MVLTLGVGGVLAGAAMAFWFLVRERERRAALEAARASEVKFRRLFDQSMDAIFHTTPDGRILDLNPAALNLLALEPGAVGDYRAQDFCRHPTDLERLRSAILEEGGVTDFEAKLETADGRPLIVLCTARPVHDAAGEVVALQGVARDITERKVAERRLRDSEEQLRLVHDNAPIGIAHVDLGGAFLRVNRALCEMTGYDRDELTGMTFQELTHPGDVERDVSMAQRLLDGEISSYELEKRYIRKGGRTIWVHLTASVVREPDGVPLHLVAHVRDISERIRVRSQLETRERRFRSLIENASDLIAILDSAGRFEYLSPAFESTLGYDAEGLAHSDAFKLVHPDDVRTVRTTFASLLIEPDGNATVEYRLRDARGDWRILESRGTNLLHDPAIRGIVVNSRDVTDRRMAEAELRRSAEEQEAILSTITEAVVLVEADGSLVYTNPAAEQILGITPGSDPDRTYDDPRWQITSVDGGPFPDEQLPFVRVMETGEPVFGVRHGIERPDGHAIISVNAAPLRAEDGAIAGMVASIQDVTERVEAEREVRRLNEELEQRVEERTAELAAANEELEAFAYSVSHDLRAPLRAIHGFSDALVEDYGDRLDGEAREFLGRIQANSQRMGQLIDDILELSRVSRKELQRETVDLVELVRGALHALVQLEPERELELEAPDTLPATGDPKLLRVVMENLTGNAWKFSRHESVARIELTAGEKHGERIYRVRDNGVGFDTKYADKLFKAFHRLHRDSEFEGTGIGLATVSRIVRRHGGWVEATGAVGEGATVTFSLGEPTDDWAGPDGPDPGPR